MEEKTPLDIFIDEVYNIAAFLNGEGDTGNVASRKLRESLAKIENARAMGDKL